MIVSFDSGTAACAEMPKVVAQAKTRAPMRRLLKTFKVGSLSKFELARFGRKSSATQTAKRSPKKGFAEGVRKNYLG
ncbi:MAG: hypothetical protein HQ445_04160 [Polaromonas sp.]|nr:hypothetical protein [Polaromonas sp.]